MQIAKLEFLMLYNSPLTIFILIQHFNIIKRFDIMNCADHCP